MAKSDKSDPTEDPKFQKVVQHFLKTPPRKHGEDRKGDKGKAGKDGARESARAPRKR